MRIRIVILLLFITSLAFGQVVRSVGVVYTASAPVHTPTGQGAWVAIDTTSGSWYEWERTTGVWRDAGYRIQLTNTTGEPNYTPTKARGRVAVNSNDSLFVYQGGSWNLLSGGGFNQTFTRSGDTLFIADGGGTLNVVLPSGSVDTDDQGLTIGGSGPTYSIDIDGGSDVTISAGGIITLSEGTANVLTFTANETDGSVTNEIQNVDSLVLSGTTLGISLSSDGVAQKTVDLSSLQDGTGTDDQKVDTFAIVSNVLRLSVESDAEPFKSVDLSPYLDNTDGQTLTIDSTSGRQFTLTISGGNAVTWIDSTAEGGSLLNGVNTYIPRWTGATTQDTTSIKYTTATGRTDFGTSLTLARAPVQIETETTTKEALVISGNGSDSGMRLFYDTISILTSPNGFVFDTQEEVGGGAAASTTGIWSMTSTGMAYGDRTPEHAFDLSGFVTDLVVPKGSTANRPTGQTGSVRYNTSNGVFEGRTAAGYKDFAMEGDVIIDTFDITANTLSLSLANDGVPAETVDLSPYLDNTDTQDLSIDSAGDWYTVSLVNGGAVNIKKDTDTQLTEEQVEDFVGGMVTGNTETLITVDYQDSDGTIDFVVEDNLALYDNTTSGFISAEVDGSVTNEIQQIDTFDISSNTLRASLSSDGVPFKSVDLSPYLDNTDAQTFSGSDDGTTFTLDLSGAATDISFKEGSNVTLTRTGTELTIASTAGTDDQNLTIEGSGPTYTIDIESGSDVTIEAAGISTLSEPSANVLRITSTEVDGSVTNEIQGFTGSDNGIDFTLDLSGTSDDITISEGESITIARTNTKLTVGTTQALNSGTYTPTLFNTTNIDASTASVMGYYRVGNSVTVYGEVLINATAATTATVLGMTIPISSNFTGGGDLAGSAHSVGAPSNSGSVTGDSANDRAYLTYRSSADVGDVIYAIHFSYIIK